MTQIHLTHKTRLKRVLIAMGLLFSGGGAGLAYGADALSDVGSLFEKDAPGGVGGVFSSWPRDELAVRSRMVGIDSQLLARLSVGDWVSLSMFDDVDLFGVVDQSDGRTLGGRLRDAAGPIVGGSFLFVVHDDAVAGYIRVPGVGVYRIRGTRNGGGLVELLMDDSFGVCDGALRVADEQGRVGDELVPSSLVPSPVQTGPGGDTRSDIDIPTMVDVLVAYTPKAKNAAGGASQILAQIDLAIAATNRAYDNSLIAFDLRLVHAVEVVYDENANEYSRHLRRLTSMDGLIDEVHELRETYGADMVALMVNDRRSCGNAWLMRTNSVSFASSAFSVTTWTCAVGNMSFAHELGHNMGACHAPSDPCSGGIFPYSNGHRFAGDSGSSWRSVMAYSPGSRIEYFSDPNIFFDGQATGLLGVSQNGLTLNQTGPTVSNFRESVLPCVADFTGDGNLDFFDVSFFLAFFANSDPKADVNGDGHWNFYDVNAFLTQFTTGCP